jgi:hypothetical protein
MPVVVVCTLPICCTTLHCGLSALVAVRAVLSGLHPTVVVPALVDGSFVRPSANVSRRSA